MEMKTLTIGGIEFDVVDDEAVHFTEQELTDEQKAQVKKNIGINDWFEIADITTTEEVNSFHVNTDKNGNPFECKQIKALMVLPSALSGGQTININCGSVLWASPGYSFNQGTGDLARTYEIYSFPGHCMMFGVNGSQGVGFGSAATIRAIRCTDDTYKQTIKQFFIARSSATTDMYPVGTNLKVWGLRV